MNLRGELAGIVLLSTALLFGAIGLAPELSISRAPLNDDVFHLAASERLAESVGRDEPLLDPWVSEWALGYPLWRSYQPLPHFFIGLAMRLAAPALDHATTFALLQYLLLVTFPLSVYVGARLLGLSPGASGLASLLILAPSGAGDFGRYGIGFGSTVWRGAGLLTQLVALHTLVIGLGLATRAFDRGRHRFAPAVALAMTCLSHIVFGYVAALSVVLLAIVGPHGQRATRVSRLVMLGALVLALTAWFTVPLVLNFGQVNHSVWEPQFKWDSFGAPTILGALTSGELFDHGRAPVLSLLLAAGAFVALLMWREATARRLLTLACFWLLLFFGRGTWGHLLLLVGAPSDMHLHRLQAAFELFAILLASWGMDRALSIARSWPLVRIAVVTLLGVAVLGLGRERAAYLGENALLGRQNLAALARSRTDLDSALQHTRDILRERPGRVSAGLAGGWGGDFKIGDVPVYASLTRAHFDQASFLYHALSRAGDLMVMRNDDDAAQAAVFGIRAVIAPADRQMPAWMRRRSTDGAFAVYEVASEGYFGLVDVGARYVGPASTTFEPSTAWLASALPSAGVVVALQKGAMLPQAVPDVAQWQPLPTANAEFLSPRGNVVEETKSGETYRARISAARFCFATFKANWHPDLAASLDGRAVPLIRVTPGFGAVALSPGVHELVVRYRPSPLKPFLVIVGALAFISAGVFRRRQSLFSTVQRAVERLGAHCAPMATPRAMTVVAFAVLTLVALRPLFRGQLIAGHDALEYPPRLVEMERVLADSHIPPIWAPDLSSGHGQPLFEFAPPLVYVAGLPLRILGAGLSDSLQLGLALLFTLGAAACYRLGRRSSLSRVASLTVVTTWLFAPYAQLDLYVRSAYAEASAIAIAPIALLALWRATDRPSPWTLSVAGVAVALVPLAHNGAALLLVPALAIIVVAIGVSRGIVNVIAGVAALIVGLGLSAGFWIPALREKEFVQTHLLREDFLQWSQHAIRPWQLVWGRWGYGLSVPGPADEMSFALGWVHIALALAGVIVAARAANRTWRWPLLGISLVALAGAWLATDQSAVMWGHVEPLQYLAYPWRALMLPSLMLPLAAMPALQRLGRRCWPLIVLLVVANIAHTEPRGYTTFDDEYFAPAAIARNGISTTTREEYVPRWATSRSAFWDAPLIVVQGQAEIRAAHVASARQEFLVHAAADAELETATFYYPGWTLLVDGRESALSPVDGRGTMRFRLSSGDHQVRLELRPTPTRHAASRMTQATAIVLLVSASVGALAAIRRRRRSTLCSK